MKTFFNRIYASVLSFFPEAKKAFLLQPLTPFSRLEYTIHSSFILLFSYLIGLIRDTGSSLDKTSMGTLLLIAFLYILCFIPLLRIVMNRFYDLNLGFDDDKAQQFTPKKFIAFLGICFGMMLIFSLQIKIDVTSLSFFSTPKTSINFTASNQFFIFLTSFCFALINIALTSLNFPSKSLNIFENITFSNKTKEFAFYVFIGLLPLCVAFYLHSSEVDETSSKALLIGIAVLTSLIILLSKNFYARFLLFIFLLDVLQGYNSFLSYSGYRFAYEHWYPKFSLLFFPLFLLTCRKNFMLSILCIFGMSSLAFKPFSLFFVICLYFVLIIDFFDFKKSKDFIYSSLWAMSISALFVFIAPLIHIPFPQWMQALPPYLLFILVSGVFMGMIYLNSYIKNKPKHQLLTIFILGFFLNLAFFLPKDFKEFFPFTSYTFLLILLALIFWIISNDEKISSAYKLATLSTFTLVFFSPLSLIKKSELVYTMVSFSPLLVMLILSYLFYKIKSPFKVIIFVSTLSSFVFTLYPHIASVLVNDLFLVDSQFFNNLHNDRYIITSAITALLFPISCYIFYKHKDSFNPNLTMR